MPTFRKVVIEVPFDLMLPTVGGLMNPTPNPFYGLVTFMNDSTPKKDRYTYDGVTYTYNSDVMLEMFVMDLMDVVINNGGEIKNVPLFFQIDLAAVVPDALKPLDESDQPVDITWQQFLDASGGTWAPTVDTDGNLWMGTNVFGNGYLPVSQAKALNVPLITLPELLASVPSGE